MSDSWTTADECLWLDTIGRTYEKTRKMDEAVLLARYLESAARRRSWGQLDRQKVLRHAARRLAARGAAA
jgi:hypothetical protein